MSACETLSLIPPLLMDVLRLCNFSFVIFFSDRDKIATCGLSSVERSADAHE